MKLLVIDPLGMYICRHGQRAQGETFDNLPDELAQDLADQYSSRCELVEESVPLGHRGDIESDEQ